MTTNSEGTKENELPYPKYSKTSPENQKEKNDISSDKIDSSCPEMENNADIIQNVIMSPEIETVAERRRNCHVYIAYENNMYKIFLFRPIVRSRITDGDIDVILESSDSLNQSLKFDDNLFNDVVYQPCRKDSLPRKKDYQGKKHYRCIIDGCGRIIRSKIHLKLHYLAHCDIKPYKCTEKNCNARYLTKNLRQKHARTHTKSRGYKCPFCDFVALAIEVMNDHVHDIHPEMKRR